MKPTRRDFIKYSTAALLCGTATPFNETPLIPLVSAKNALQESARAPETTITILHTNDTHSQLEPFPAGTRAAGMGGIARRATFIKRVKQQNPNTLMVDAGDMFQGTPYFNFYRGEIEIKGLSAAGYDVVTLGNHDFDEGTENLARVLKFATFDVVSANYDVSASPLQQFVKPYVIKNLSGIRVALFGMGVNFEGLVVADKHRQVIWHDPIDVARKLVPKLRQEEKADLVVAISHMGLKYDKQPLLPSDVNLAKAVPGIDFIAGGHTHTFMKEPEIVRHPDGRETVIFQVGYAGINVGRVDFNFQGRQLVSWQSGIHNVDGKLQSQIWHNNLRNKNS
jgi:5'-nucleotidase